MTQMWNDVSFLLFQQPGSEPKDSVSSYLIDCAVHIGQPNPVLAHVEWFIPRGPAWRTLGSSHAATYIGESFGWQGLDDDFYDRTAGHWRAVPVYARMITPALENACEGCGGAPYSMLRYLTTLPLLSGVGALLPDRPTSPGHCGTLVARTLKLALPNGESDAILPHGSHAYGPSSTYNSVSSWLGTEGYRAIRRTGWHRQWALDTEGKVEKVVPLHTLSDTQLSELSVQNIAESVVSLIDRLGAARSTLDSSAAVEVERLLAVTLLRIDKRWG